MNSPHCNRTGVPRQAFLPPRNSDCLCGSGEKFKRCCAANLPGWQLGKRTRAVLDVEDYTKALVACRTDITQYTLWHKTNTAPLLHSASEKADYLLNLDIRALAELGEQLGMCYAKTGRSDEFPAVLERLRSNINHPRWQRKVIYLQAIHAMLPDWNERAGRRELKKLGSMELETDIETLQLYIDLFHDDLNFAARQKLVDRIIHLAESAIDRLHYQCVKAIELLLIGDTQGAELELTAAIEAYRSAGGEKSDSLYDRHRYAMALDLLARLNNDQELLDQAIAICKELIEEDGWTESGKANMFRQLGDGLRCKRAWALALDAYRKAYDIQPLAIFQVFLAECLLETDEWMVAADVIRAVNINDLDATELVDYAFTFAVVAIDAGDRAMLAKAEELLRSLNIPTPYFRERCGSLLLEVIDIVQSGKSRPLSNKAKTLLRSMVSTATRYLKLEPNFMGIGINLGKILEDLNKGEQEHSTKRNEN